MLLCCNSYRGSPNGSWISIGKETAVILWHKLHVAQGCPGLFSFVACVDVVSLNNWVSASPSLSTKATILMPHT